MDKMNGFFGYRVVEKLKFISFDDEKKNLGENIQEANVTNYKFKKRLKMLKMKKLKNR